MNNIKLFTIFACTSGTVAFVSFVVLASFRFRGSFGFISRGELQSLYVISLTLCVLLTALAFNSKNKANAAVGKFPKLFDFKKVIFSVAFVVLIFFSMFMTI